jgi:hypothetical protein
MKCKFLFNGTRYISPSKKEAKKFLQKWKYDAHVSRFRTTWKLKHVERAPSYWQMVSIDLPGIEYK